MKNRILPFVVIALAFSPSAPLLAEEEQSHGFVFEQRVLGQAIGKGYTDEWDIPGKFNRANPGVPISVKLIQWGGAIYLGDALRQCSIDEPFEMVVGFYEKEPSRIVALHSTVIQPERWHALWGTVTPRDIEKLMAIAKTGTLEEAREKTKVEAERLRSLTAGMSINPKLDENQRRIQCSLPFDIFHRELLGIKKPEQQKRLRLWGDPFPSKMELGQRSLQAAP
jgi:hypothetical protein